MIDSKASPKTNWDKSARPPGDLAIVLKATGAPIDHFPYEAVELLRDTKRVAISESLSIRRF